MEIITNLELKNITLFKKGIKTILTNLEIYNADYLKIIIIIII
jgi:hypothetical protein